MGNIVGSTISNILGAFSLGLLFNGSQDEELFDRSSKIYSTLLFVLTAVIAGIIQFGHGIMWRLVGGLAIGLFFVYVCSIAWTIYKGLIRAPEASDSDSSDDEQDTTTAREAGPADDVSETTPLFRGRTTSSLFSADTDSTRGAKQSGKHSLVYHIALLGVGFVAIVLSAYVLSHAASTIVHETGLGDVVFGVVILSIATTVPEKFIAVISGYRGQMGIMVANTVGSNIFLLSLCIGILWVATDGHYDQGSVAPAEVGVMLGSAALMLLTVWLGKRWARAMGVVMLIAYVAFLVLEFAVIHRV